MMAVTFMPRIHSEEELEAVQREGLRWTVRHAYEGSEFYRARFDEVGVKPHDIQNLDDLSKIPIHDSR